MDWFTKYLRTIERARREIDRREEQYNRIIRRRDEQGVKDYKRQIQKERRDRQRKMLLDIFVPDRRCPICRRVFLDPMMWVIAVRSPTVMKLNRLGIPLQLRCRRCKDVKLRRRADMDGIVCVDGDKACIDTAKLKRFREIKCVSLRLFAGLCGWSAVYQLKIEKEGRITLDKVAGYKIRDTLQKLCITDEEVDRLQEEMQKRYEWGINTEETAQNQ